MTDCTYNPLLDAYHDGELDPSRRAEVDRHLETCARCAAALAELRGTSQLFMASPAPRLSQISLHRLHANLDLVLDRGLVRLARVLSGVAAVVLVAGSLWLMRPHPVAKPTAVAANNTDLAVVVQLEEQAQQVATDAGPNDWIVSELAK